jgi:transposase
MQKDSEISKNSSKGKPDKSKQVKGRAAAAAEKYAQDAENAQQSHEPAPPAIITHKDYQYERGLYSDELLPKLEELAAKGLTYKQIAESFCIGERTLYDWKRRYPQVLQALQKYRGVADRLVENAMYKNALGQTFTEIKRERRFNKTTKEYEIVVTEQVDKFIPGNVVAQIFWLKNRMPERYKDKVETVHSLGAGMEGMVFALKRRED